MSYILSALKKADRERHHGDVPDLLTVQQEVVKRQPAIEESSTKPYWVAAGVALFFSGLWLVVEFFPNSSIVTIYDTVTTRALQPPERISSSLSHQHQPGREVAASESELLHEVVDSPDVSSQFQPPVTRRMTDGYTDLEMPKRLAPELRSWPYAGEIPDLDALPPVLREQLPRLVLSGHLYSLAHSKARKVILNGIALKEKQYLHDDLMVSEITPDGVIIDFQGRLFSMNASQMFR